MGISWQHLNKVWKCYDMATFTANSPCQTHPLTSPESFHHYISLNVQLLPDALTRSFQTHFPKFWARMPTALIRWHGRHPWKRSVCAFHQVYGPCSAHGYPDKLAETGTRRMEASSDPQCTTVVV